MFKILRKQLSVVILILVAFICFELILKRYKSFDKVNFNTFTERIFRKPVIYSESICNPLQSRLLEIIGSSSSNWSITVIDNSGVQIVNINSQTPMIPASNQKLITTAFALDKLGIDYRLKTSIYKNYNGYYELYGSGDPDINIHFINEIVTQIKNDLPINEQTVKVIIYDEPKVNWWPASWISFDRSQSYGAPISRLAYISNSTSQSIINPINTFKSKLRSEFELENIDSIIVNKPHPRFLLSKLTGSLIYSIDSAPFRSLLSLSNSESHNFTAEVLLRQASNSWSINKSTRKVLNWLNQNQIPVNNFQVFDGSGLSRNNRLTTFGIAHLLHKMSRHKYSSTFKSSLAVAGLRGTLRGNILDDRLIGRFSGKTGTLTGVKSFSGFLQTNTGDLSVSIISNNATNPNYIINKLLISTASLSSCSTRNNN